MKNIFFLLILLFVITAPENLSSQCSSGYEQRSFDWDPAYWQASIVEARDYAIGGTNMTIEFSGTFTNSNPRDFSHFDPAIYGGWSFIDGSQNLEMSGYNGSTQTMTMTFNNPVENLQFSIYDIDNNDIVAVSGSSMPTLSAETGSPTFTISGNTASSNVGENLGTSNTTLNVQFTEPVTSVTITLDEGDEIYAQQWIGISDLQMCVPDVFSIGDICASNTNRLDWTDVDFDPNTLPATQTFTISDASDNDLVDVQLVWGGETGTLTSSTNNSEPGYFQDQKGMVAVDDGLEILADAVNSGSTVKLTVNFLSPGTDIPFPIEDLRFSIYDIDNSIVPTGYSPIDRRDMVTLSGSPLIEADSDGSCLGIYGSMIIGSSERHTDGNDGNGGNPSPTESSGITGRGTVNVFYPGSTSSFTIDYTEAHGFSDNPALRGIELSDFIFCASILPIDLLSFKGNEQERMVNLSWTTLTETNNDLFEIYHSTDSRNFNLITSLKGKGNNSTLANYSFLHESPKTGINYYKLKQIDYDGRSSQSDIIAVNIDGVSSRLNIHPNPTSGSVNITTDSDEFELKIYNAVGTIIMKTDQRFIDLTSQPKGIYYFQLASNNVIIETKKVIKY